MGSEMCIRDSIETDIISSESIAGNKRMYLPSNARNKNPSFNTSKGTLVFDLGHGMSCDFVLPILIKVTVLKPKAFFEGYA